MDAQTWVIVLSLASFSIVTTDPNPHVPPRRVEPDGRPAPTPPSAPLCSVLGDGASAQLLRLASAALLTETLLARSTGGGRRPSRSVHVQCGREPRTEALQGQILVARLRPPLRRRGPGDRPDPIQQARSLSRAERARLRDVESHLDGRERAVRVLPTGAARRGSPPLELVGVDHARPRDSHAPFHSAPLVIGCRTRRCAVRSASPRTIVGSSSLQ